MGKLRPVAASALQVIDSEIAALTNEITEIERQIETACALFNSGGPAAESGWLIRKRAEVKRLKNARQIRESKRGELRREIAWKESGTLAQCFVDAARETLPADQFQFLMTRAKELSSVA